MILIGGLGFSSTDIGLCLSIMGCMTLYFQLIVYPYLSKYYSALDLYRTGTMLYAFIFVGFPINSTFISPNEEGWIRSFTWPALLLNMSLRHFCNVLCFTSVMIMVIFLYFATSNMTY